MCPPNFASVIFSMGDLIARHAVAALPQAPLLRFSLGVCCFVSWSRVLFPSQQSSLSLSFQYFAAGLETVIIITLLTFKLNHFWEVIQSHTMYNLANLSTHSKTHTLSLIPTHQFKGRCSTMPRRTHPRCSFLIALCAPVPSYF